MLEFIRQFEFADWWILVVFPLFPLSCWILYSFLILRKRNPLPAEKRNEVPWGAIDVVLVMASMLFAKFISQLVAVGLISQKTGLPVSEIGPNTVMENANILVVTGIVFSLLQLGFAIWYLRATQGSTWTDLGFSPSQFKRNVAIGLVATIMVIPLVLVINLVLHAVLQERYTHQVMTMVLYSLLSTAVSTVLVAPLVEEFHFRVVLQGFLQRIHHLDLAKKIRIVQGDQRAEQLIDSNQQAGVKPRKKLSRGTETESDSMPDTPIPWWPILVSSFLFASVHMGQGAAPYALFVLALFLGFLYRQTNSLIPCILVHFLLNLWSFIALVYSLE